MESLACAMFPMIIIGFVVCFVLLQIEGAKNIAKQYQKDLTTQHGFVIGRVQKIETWKDEPFKHKDGRMTLTLDITDRCRVTFTDGRTKEMIGMPKEAIPTDKDVAIVWARFDLFLEAVDAEEFKKRQKEAEANKPAPKGEDD